MNNALQNQYAKIKDFSKDYIDWDYYKDNLNLTPFNTSEPYNYYNVLYRTDSGSIGKHQAVAAKSVFEASVISPILLAINTPYTEKNFTVLEIIPTPVEEQPK